jgi:hypothetical protein
MPFQQAGGMTVQERVNVLTDAIERLEVELRSSPTKTRREEIVELLQIAKVMRGAIIAKKATASRQNPLE